MYKGKAEIRIDAAEQLQIERAALFGAIVRGSRDCARTRAGFEPFVGSIVDRPFEQHH
jgi:hypothetical protein